MDDYLSDGWFESVTALLQVTDTSEAASLRVTYEPNGSIDGRAHTQTFAGGHLVDWVPGAHPRADLVLSRSRETDRGDLLARIDQRDVFAQTRVRLPALDLDTDILGVVGPLNREVEGVPGDLSIRFSIELPDSPFGAVVADYELTHDAIYGHLDRDAAQVRIRCRFDEVLTWMHEEQLLFASLLLSDDRSRHIEGDIFRMSALTGIVSSRPPRANRTLSDLLRRYQRLRQSDDFQRAMDVVDGVTSE